MAVGKKITDLTASGSLKDTDLTIVHDGNGTKRSTLTQLSEYMGTKFSNPNLLINPDFKINQRGSATYTETQWKRKYTVDRWAILKVTATKNSDGTFTVSADNNGGYLTQPLEAKVEEDYMLTCNVSSVTGNVHLGGNDGALLKPGINTRQGSQIQEVTMYLEPNSSVTLKWAKLEHGSIATPFVASNPTEELMKCQRFTHAIDTDCLLGISLNGILYVKIWTPIRAGATLTNLTDNMVAVINGNIKNLSLQEVRITEYNTYLLLFSIEGGGNDQRVPCALADGKILLDAELY